MALVAAGLIDVNGDLIDTVRSVTCAAEASVGAGATISDGGDDRYIAETHQATAAGERIDMGTIAFSANRTMAVRFVKRAASGGDYHAMGSRGGVFENNSEFSFGWRDDSVNPFMYGRDGGTLRGNEASGQPSLTNGAVYTILYRCAAGSKQLYYCAPDIGGAGVDFVQVVATTDAVGADGSQHVYVGGPNTFTSGDASINAGILGVLIYDHRVDDTERDAIIADFYAQIPTGGGPVTHDAAASFTAVATLTPTARALRAAQASFAAVATTSASATAIRGVSASFTATATLTPRARALRAARATFAGVGTFSASIAGGIVSAACSFAGVGTANFAASRIAHARASFAGVGTVTAAARRIAGVAASFSATATLSPTARAIRAAAVVFSGVGTFDAVAVADEASYQGKYASDHAGALAAVKTARGFAGDHAGALSAVRGAGR